MIGWYCNRKQKGTIQLTLFDILLFYFAIQTNKKQKTKKQKQKQKQVPPLSDSRRKKDGKHPQEHTKACSACILIALQSHLCISI